MEKTALKKRLFSACLSKQQALINTFRKKMESLLVVEGWGNDEGYEGKDLSNPHHAEETSALAETLHFAEDEMKQLRFIY